MLKLTRSPTCKFVVNVHRESAAEAGTEAAQQQGVVDMSLVSSVDMASIRFSFSFAFPSTDHQVTVVKSPV